LKEADDFEDIRAEQEGIKMNIEELDFCVLGYLTQDTFEGRI